MDASRTRAATVGLLVGVAAVATACGGGGGSGSETSSGDGGEPRFGSEEFGLSMDELAAKVEQVEGLIGRCMSAAGFEYVPVDFERVKEGMDADQTAPGLNDEDYIAQYGLGVTTQFDKPGREIGLGERNVQIYEGISAEEQVAYDHALLGDHREATFAQTLELEDFAETGGCTREAVEQSFSPEEMSASYINPGDVAIDQDPRVVEALAEWSSCMQDAGFDYAHPDDVDEDLKERLLAITGGADPASLTGADADALAQLQDEELAIAPIATDCEADVLEPVVEDVESEIYGAPQQ